MKGFKGWKKWIVAGVLTLAIAAPAGAASAASGYSNVQYKVYYVNQGSNADWNAFLQQYLYRQSPVYSKPATPPAAKPAPAPKPVQKPAPTGKPATVSSFASQVLSLVNQERAKSGLKALAWNQKLADMAMVKAQDMKNNNYFAHNSPTYGSPFDMMKKYGITYHYAGENIAMGQRSPQEVMKGWMNSPGHKANIMSGNFSSIGVAYYNGEWVQEFIG